MRTIPTVITEQNGSKYSTDLYSLLLKNRIILVSGVVDDDMAEIIIGQLLYLASESNDPIQMYINSPGGSVTAGLAMVDIMKFIPNKIITICTGMAASMGSILLASGDAGLRFVLPHGRVMIHEVSGGASGKCKDAEAALIEMKKSQDILYGILADTTGQSLDKIAEDCKIDKWFSAEEAKEYGLVDTIINSKDDINEYVQEYLKNNA